MTTSAFTALYLVNLLGNSRRCDARMFGTFTSADLELPIGHLKRGSKTARRAHSTGSQGSIMYSSPTSRNSDTFKSKSTFTF